MNPSGTLPDSSCCIDEAVSDVDTGAKWYNAENIDDEDIALLVYD